LPFLFENRKVYFLYTFQSLNIVQCSEQRVDYIHKYNTIQKLEINGTYVDNIKYIILVLSFEQSRKVGLDHFFFDWVWQFNTLPGIACQYLTSNVAPNKFSNPHNVPSFFRYIAFRMLYVAKRIFTWNTTISTNIVAWTVITLCQRLVCLQMISINAILKCFCIVFGSLSFSF